MTGDLWTENLQISSSPFCVASPKGGVVELDPQQVLHAGLGGVVNDELVVQEVVTAVAARPRIPPRTHRHRHTVPEK